MQEDIDGDLVPDFSYEIDGEERTLRRGKYKLWIKHQEGKISYEKYLIELEENFAPILEISEWNEIKAFKILKEKEHQELKVIADKRQTEQEKTIRNVILIIFILFALAGAISGLLKH